MVSLPTEACLPNAEGARALGIDTTDKGTLLCLSGVSGPLDGAEASCETVWLALLSLLRVLLEGFNIRSPSPSADLVPAARGRLSRIRFSITTFGPCGLKAPL